MVSVIMPCYNARESLPWALASVLAQTYGDWELVLIDDGSNDHPEEIVAQAADGRIRLVRSAGNRGRGHARQVALDNARGELVTMLDADDWMYPTRLERQVAVLREAPEIALASAGMAIVDRDNELVGVRLTGNGEIAGPHRGVKPPVAHASSMYRRADACDVGFDAAMRLGEDQDFLLRLLQGRRYVVMPDVLYVYTELASVSARKAAGAQPYMRRRLRKHLRRYPIEAAAHIGQSYGKQAAYLTAASLGLDARMLSQRSRIPSDHEREAFDRARSVVASIVRSRFGTS